MRCVLGRGRTRRLLLLQETAEVLRFVRFCLFGWVDRLQHSLDSLLHFCALLILRWVPTRLAFRTVLQCVRDEFLEHFLAEARLDLLEDRRRMLRHFGHPVQHMPAHSMDQWV